MERDRFRTTGIDKEKELEVVSGRHTGTQACRMESIQEASGLSLSDDHPRVPPTTGELYARSGWRRPPRPSTLPL